MLKIKKALSVSLLLAATSMSAQAKLVLDTFTYYTPAPTTSTVFNTDGNALPFPDTGTTVDPITGVTGTVMGLSAANGLASFDFNATGSINFIDPTLTVGGGILNVATSAPGIDWTLNISYSDPTVGGAPQDFASAGDSFYFDVIFADFGGGDTFTTDVTVYSVGGGVSTASLPIPTGVLNNEELMLSFASFVGTADFSQVLGIKASLAGGNGFDLTLSEVGIVPEPSSIALLGLGLLGLGLRSRKKSA